MTIADRIRPQEFLLKDELQHTISAVMLGHAMTGLRHAGVDDHGILRQCEIEPEMFKQPQARISIEKATQLIRLCVLTLGDEALGLLERPQLTGHFRLLTLSVLHTRTLGRAIRHLIELHNLFDNSLVQSLNVGGTHAELVLTRLPGHKILDGYAIDSQLSVLHRLYGWLCNERVLLDQVKLDFSAPDYRQEYKYIYYGAPILFNHRYSSITFDRSYLDHEIVQNEDGVESYSRRAPLDLFLPVSVGGVVTQAVRKRIKAVFSQSNSAPGLEDVSESIGFKPHTLQRRLKDEGSSFHTISSQVRRDIAIHHLGIPNTSVEQIAYYTGYTEPSAFIRAFKSWTGVTPLQFRKGLEYRQND